MFPECNQYQIYHMNAIQHIQDQILKELLHIRLKHNTSHKYHHDDSVFIQ